MTETGGRYRFGDLVLDLGQRKLSRGAEQVRLSKLSFDLLRVLVAAAPNVLTHDELAEKVWGPRRIVTPENLAQRLMLLRQALGDVADEPRYIEGVRGQGYRLVTPVQPEPQAESLPGVDARPRVQKKRWMMLAAAVAGVVLVFGFIAADRMSTPTMPNSVAVLPFANMSGSEADGYFALGMHDEIINRLVKVGGLTVISRATMMRYASEPKTPREVARELNVAAVMEGSVRRAGDTVRVTVQLINPDTGATLWSDTYNGDLADVADIFAMQANIATNVAGVLETRLSVREQSRLGRVPTRSGEAYAHYLAAVAAEHSASPEGSERALAELRRAVEIDPAFGLAWATLGYTLAVAPTWQPDRTAEFQDEALSAGLRALELEPDLAEVHRSLQFVATVRGEWLRSELEYGRALELGATRGEMPDRANLELAVGHIEQARVTLRADRQVNPLNSSGLAFFVAANEIFGDRGAVDDAYQQGRTFMKEWPFGEFLMNFVRLGRGELASLVGDTVVAPRFRAEFADQPSAEAALAAVRSWYESLERPNHNDHMLVAAWAAHYGDIELSLAAAAASTRTRAHNVWFLWLPLFDQVRQTEGFVRLVTDLGLVEYWEAHGWPASCTPSGQVHFDCR
jgi:adenylate cyclase